MRPAGMSSDEEEDDDYFPLFLTTKKRNPENQQNVMDNLPEIHSAALRNILDNSNKSALFHRAVKEADFDKMEELIENGVSVNDSNINEWTPLMEACSDGKYEVVEFLLEKGADPNLHKELFTPLMACCSRSYIPEEDRLECIRHLIRCGAQVNATDKHKTTVLMMAAERGFDNIVDELLNVPDIDVNLTDRTGWNALFHAVFWNNKSVVEKLINAGVDVDHLNLHNEYGVIQIAEMKNYRNILKILKEYKGEDMEKDNEVPVPRRDFNDILRNSLNEFRDQFPDEDGNGGFSNDVKDIFAGVGIEKLYEKLKIQTSLPQLLLLKNLEDIGIKFEPVRRKIRKGVHRYHRAPWHSSSLHPVRHMKHLELEDYIQAISNVTKHLAIMHTTLEYVRNKISLWKGKTSPFNDKEIVNSLVGCYVETQKTKRLIKNISELTDLIKPVGEVEVDYIGPTVISERTGKGVWWKTGIVCSILWFIYAKYKFP